ncbi:fused MFS/spermidine synthase [Engelhardtia mirabilis]|uniref:Spermidine synthase n=1 Tax=Engelhardtia mirabilis TaxID=2528011 RepID=A0A518BLC4_9BACT|nr:spermidine synthase [Planctomycetes bacterium Pla133]QDV02093.1 spermidine synthase [Planctomycetes bacterium Pla86]
MDLARDSSATPIRLVSFASGFTVLALEIVGARMVAPAFGGSIYVWAALLTTTLLSLGVGYAVGGFLSDRFDPRRALEQVVGIAALILLALPFYKSSVASAAASLGVRAGALVTTGLLLGPPLVTLGCVLPLCLGARVRAVDRLGREFGTLSLWSTAGSVLGTLSTGFYLLQWLSLSEILRALAGAMVVCLALVLWSNRRRPGRPRRASALAGYAALVAFVPFEPQVASDGAVTIPSLYGEVRVEDDRRSGHRTLFLDGLPNSRVGLDGRSSESDVVYGLELVTAMRPKLRRVLFIGLGAGRGVEVLWNSHGIVSDVVEIDPSVVRVAREYFQFESQGAVVVGDGRRFCRSTSQCYDAVVLDAFSGDSHPYHLLSAEALEDYRSCLAPDGVLACNLLTYASGERARLRASVAATFRSAFANLSTFNANPRRDSSGVCNLLFFASDGPLDIAPETFSDDSGLASYYRSIVDALAASPTDLPPGVVLTDDHNPADLLGAEAFLDIRRESKPFRVARRRWSIEAVAR